jgi:hypothetical protein
MRPSVKTDTLGQQKRNAALVAALWRNPAGNEVRP